MTQPVYIANWKMFHSLETADAWMNGWCANPIQNLPSDAVVMVCPPAPLLYPLYAQCHQRGLNELYFGGQNLHQAFKGAFTGEMSGVSLWSVGATAVLIGHSERRRMFGDTDEITAQKVEQALVCGLTPVLCIGESMEERDGGETVAVLSRQLDAGLAKATSQALIQRQSDSGLPALIVAYEPVWAIGSGRAASPELAEEALTVIRDWLNERYPASQQDQISLLYGGSVKADNVGGFTAVEGCDGVLVGGASLEPAEFQSLLVAGLIGQGYSPTVLAPAAAEIEP